MSPIQTRKNELLVESAINRQVIRLETAHLRQNAGWLRPETWLRERWMLVLPLAGILLAWNYRRIPELLKGPLGVELVRRVWDAASSLRKRRSEG